MGWNHLVETLQNRCDSGNAGISHARLHAPETLTMRQGEDPVMKRHKEAQTQ
jgi:hypothetical protein